MKVALQEDCDSIVYQFKSDQTDKYYQQGFELNLT